MPDYVELHCHSHFSFLEGASSPEELLDHAAALGMDTLALTDHDGLYGSMAFAQQAAERGIHPITGAELTLAGGAHVLLLAENRTGYGTLCRLVSRGHLLGEKGAPHLPAEELALVRTPWQIDCSLTGPGDFPIDTDDRPPLDDTGLIVLLGRCSEIGQALDAGDPTTAEAAIRRYQQWFGPDNVFLELQQNYQRGDTRRIRQLAALGRRLDVPLVATNTVHYHHPDRHRLQDVLVAIRHRATLGTSHRQRRGNREFCLKPPAEMARIFAAWPDAIANTRRIADRCRFHLATDLDYVFPSAAALTGGVPDEEALERLCRERLEERYPAWRDPGLRERALQRLEEELVLIRRHQLCGFLLVYHDILELGREVAAELRGLPPDAPDRPNPGRGRGSSVSSIVCYLVGLSHIDPVQNDLFVGRFLNEEMRSVPDIDLDFPRDIRERLILRVYERYGNDHAAMVCTFPTFRIRSAIREIGKVLDLPAVDLDRLAKLSEGGSARSLGEELQAHPEFRDSAQAPTWQLLVDLAWQIAGFPRHVSQHVGGIVLSSRPLVELVPVEHARMDGRFVLQWDKDSVDDARFVKIDFLALGMLSLVDDCLAMIRQQRGISLDLARIDYEDPAVYQMICEADTTGLFQIESRAQMSSLPSTQPRSLEDLAVQVAIIRPGPIVGGAFKPYLAWRRQLNGLEPSPYLYPNLLADNPPPGTPPRGSRSRDPDYGHAPYGARLTAGPEWDWDPASASPDNPDASWHAWRNRAASPPDDAASAPAGPDPPALRPQYLHPLLEPVLRRTAGVILFQEQILQVAIAVADFTPGEAERLRRSLGRKNAAQEVDRLKERFYAGAQANGVPEDACDRIFQMFLGFAEFGFPESHAHAFGLLAYQSAWLRYHYPAEYFAALLNSQPMGFYPPHVLVQYVRRQGMRLLRPSLLRGQARCVVEDSHQAWEEAAPSALPWQPGTPPRGGDAARRVIRLGYAYVKGLDETRAQLLADSQARHGPFRDLHDLAQRTRLPRETLEHLVLAGACDDFLPPGTPPEAGRRHLLWTLGEIVAPVARQLAMPILAGVEQPDLPPITPWEQLTADYEALDLSTEYHPLQLLRPRLHEGVASSRHLERARDGDSLVVAGLVTTRQRPHSAKGTVFMTLEDEFGKMDLIVQPAVYQRYRMLVRGEAFLLVHGQVQRRDRLTVHLRVTRLERLPVKDLAPGAHDMLPPPAHHFAQGYR